MNILLIAPASGNWRGIARLRLFNGKVFRFSMLSLLTVAELSPKEAQVSIVDEQIEEVPFDKNYDLVGITAMTALAPRAYEIAKIFREKGIPVVMGGYHASLNPEEALQYVDAVVIGCAFGAWESVIEDVKNNCLKRTYYGDTEAKIVSSLPRHKLAKSDYITTNATYATMGCANNCRFCSIGAFYKGKHHTRPAEEVIREIASFKEDFFIFIDDNLTQNREYVFNLLKRMIPLKKKWITQASIDIADDEEILKLLHDAGCIGLFVGLESFCEQALRSQDKTLNSPQFYKKAVKKIHKYGIFVESGIIFGFDSDRKDVFRMTLKMLDDIGIDAIQVSILTPLPGTKLFSDIKGRIFDYNWSHYNFRNVVFYPCCMSPEELQGGTDWVIRRFYSPWNIFRRTCRWLIMRHGIKNIIYPFVLNLGYLGRVKRFNIQGFDPYRNSFSHKKLFSLKKRKNF